MIHYILHNVIYKKTFDKLIRLIHVACFCSVTLEIQRIINLFIYLNFPCLFVLHQFVADSTSVLIHEQAILNHQYHNTII